MRRVSRGVGLPMGLDCDEAGAVKEEHRLIRNGRDLSDRVAQRIEARLQHAPDSLEDRLLLIGYWGRVPTELLFTDRDAAMARVAKEEPHVLWLIANHPSIEGLTRIDPARAPRIVELCGHRLGLIEASRESDRAIASCALTCALTSLSQVTDDELFGMTYPMRECARATGDKEAIAVMRDADQGRDDRAACRARLVAYAATRA